LRLDIDAIKATLQLDAALTVAETVAAANSALGIVGSGPIAQQVQVLLPELGLSLQPPLKLASSVRVHMPSSLRANFAPPLTTVHCCARSFAGGGARKQRDAEQHRGE
jgi:hypothetical protein